MDDFLALDATGQAEAVRRGAITAADLVELALARADELSELGAITTLLAARARARASAATGPFAGVPIVLKDAGQELAGTPMHMGTRALAAIGYHSPTTTPFAQTLEDLGFVVIGKATVPELMTGVTTEPPTGPPARNPWDPSRTPGGSSGGSAVAVAAGIVPVAHGSDSTGSLRYPASCCGLLTLKPSAGRVPARLPIGHHNALDMHADFVLARSVRDLRNLLGVFSPAPPLEKAPKPTRLGVVERMPFDLPIDQTVTAAVDQTVDHLAADHEIVSLEPSFLERFGRVFGREIGTIVDAYRVATVTWIEAQIGRTATTEDLSAEILDAAERGRQQHPHDIATALHRVKQAATAAARWTDDADVILLPVLTVPPWPIGEPPPDGALSGLLCSLASMTGQPAATIPHVSPAGLPVAVQLQGRHGDDDVLLDLVGATTPVAPAPASPPAPRSQLT